MRFDWRCLAFLALVLWAGSAPSTAQLLVTPGPAIDLGAAAPGQVLEARLTVQNAGATRAFGDVRLQGGQFWLHRSTCTLTMGLAPGATCDLLVRFSAAAVCSNYHADLEVSDWSGLQPAATVALTGSGGAGAPECDQTQYASTSRWHRMLGPYPGNNTYAGTFVVVADLGHDGEMDAILTVVPPSVPEADWYTEKLTQVYVYTYTAGGQFVESTGKWFGASPLMMPNLYEAVVADFNGDGEDDVAFACNNEDGRPYFDAGNTTRLWYTHQYAFMSGPGDGYVVQALSGQVEYGTGLSAADIDRDGDVDLVMSGEMPVPGTEHDKGIYLLVNNGAGVFAAGQVLPWSTPSNAYGHLAWPRFGDLDGDGDPDLLVGRGRDARVAVLRNDAGSFVYQRDIVVFPGVASPAGDSFHVDLGFDTASIEGVGHVQVADMDGDGIQDFVAWATGALDNQSFLAQVSMVRVARGLGGLDFQPMGAPYDHAQLGGSLFAQVLAVNGDGARDVFLRSQSRWEGRVQHKQLRNLGGGELRYENMLAYPANDPFPDSLHLADMNRDGRQDILFTFNGPYDGAPGLRGVMVNAMPTTLTGPLQTLSIADASVSEGMAGTKQAQFTVSLSQVAPTAVSFDAYTDPGTASPGLDYQSNAVIGQVIPAGSTTTTFAVTVNGDLAVEGNETFTVNLANGLDAGIADGQALGRVLNDDLALLSIADASVTEGNSGARTASFVVELSHPMPTPVTFDIATANGSASAGSDYVARSLVARVLDAGRTRFVFEVAVSGDPTTEADEAFSVSLGNVGGAAVGDGTAQGLIVDDDAAAPAARTATGRRAIPVPRDLRRGPVPRSR